MRADKTNTFCSFPLNHVAIETKGFYKLCCSATPSPHSVLEMTPEEWFKSDYMKSARDKMARGERLKDCSICYINEGNGLESKRLRSRQHLQDKEWPSEPQLATIDWRASNDCNAQCANCGPADSSSWFKPAATMSDYNIKMAIPETKSTRHIKFKEAFSEETLENLTEAYFAGGEPFHMPEFLENLSLLPEDCFIEINSNLFSISDKALQILSRYKKVNIICSLDGVGEGFELMRHPIPFDIFKKNLARLSQIPNLTIAFNYTMSMLNIFELARVIKFAQEKISDPQAPIQFTNFDFHQLTMPSYLHISNLSTSIRKKAAYFFLSQLPDFEDFLKRIGRIENVLNLVKSLEEHQPSGEESRAQAINYVKWTLKNRPTHASYLLKHGYIDDLQLQQSAEFLNTKLHSGAEIGFERVFCQKKWVSPVIYPTKGKMSLCSKSPWRRVTSEEIDVLGTDAILNRPYEIKRREDMLQGRVHSDCFPCLEMEKAGGKSVREPMTSSEMLTTDKIWFKNSFAQNNLGHLDSYKTDVTTSHKARNLDIMVGSQCDLKCVYCLPDVSTSWAKELFDFGKLNREEYAHLTDPTPKSDKFEKIFWQWFYDEGRHTVKLISFQGGEPTLMNDFYRIGNKIVDAYEDLGIKSEPSERPSLGVISNLNTKAANFKQFCDFLTRATQVCRVDLQISMESLDKRAEYIRYNVDWQHFVSNFKRLLKFKSDNQWQQWQVSFYVQMALNTLSVSSLPDVLRWLHELMKESGIPIGLAPNVVSKPVGFSPVLLTEDFASYFKTGMDYIDQVRTESFSGLNQDILENWRFYKVHFLDQFHEALLNNGKSISPAILNGRKEFYNFLVENDRRRGCNFLQTFPEYKEFYELCRSVALKENSPLMGTLNTPAH